MPCCTIHSLSYFKSKMHVHGVVHKHGDFIPYWSEKRSPAKQGYNKFHSVQGKNHSSAATRVATLLQLPHARTCIAQRVNTPIMPHWQSRGPSSAELCLQSREILSNPRSDFQLQRWLECHDAYLALKRLSQPWSSECLRVRPTISKEPVRNHQGISKESSRNHQGHNNEAAMRQQGISNEAAMTHQGSSHAAAREQQGITKEASMEQQGSINEAARNHQGSIKDAARKQQGSIKESARKRQ